MFFFFPRQSSSQPKFASMLCFWLRHGFGLFAGTCPGENSAGDNAALRVFLWLAIGSHFSAFLFAPALGIYAIWRIWIRARRAVGHLCLDRGPTRRTGSLRVPLFHADPPAQPVLRRTGRNPGLDGQRLSQPLLLHSGQSEPAGIYRRPHHRRVPVCLSPARGWRSCFYSFHCWSGPHFSQRPVSTRVTSRQLGALLLLPFAINCAAALVRAYPYGGTRHSCMLIPFATGGRFRSVGATFKAQTFSWDCRRTAHLAGMPSLHRERIAIRRARRSALFAYAGGYGIHSSNPASRADLRRRADQPAARPLFM